MASKLNRIGKDIMSAMKKATEHGTSAYDTTAEVRRIEGDIAWVHIAGGVDETPVKLTIAAKAGDSVQVRVGGGRAWITGNATAPPTDDRQANIATEKAETVEKKVSVVQKIADTARKIARNTTQYFWHTQEGTDTGAHITEKPQEEFLADPENGGGNLLMRSNGLAVRDGLTELTTFSGTGMTVSDGTGAPIATFSNSNGEGLIGLQNNEACLLGGYYDEDRVLSMSRYTTKLPDMSPVRSTSISQSVSATDTELRLYAGGGTNSNKIWISADVININGSPLADFVTAQGTDNGYTYTQWASGRLEAERVWNIGQVTLSTTETSTTKVSAEVTIPTPSIMTSGEVEVTYVGNSSNSATYLERVTRTSFRFAKNTTAPVTLQGVTVVLRLVNGRWR